MIEYEKKLLLTRQEFDCLLDNAPKNHQIAIQTNYYFDTADLYYRSRNTTLRIREKNGKYTATIKQHHKEQREKSTEISKQAYSAYDVTPFQIKNLVYQGKLITERRSWEPTEGVKVCLDINTYLMTQDYELEIEYTSEEKANQALLTMTQSLIENKLITDVKHFTYRTFLSLSKSDRFFSRKQNQKGGYL